MKIKIVIRILLVCLCSLYGELVQAQCHDCDDTATWMRFCGSDDPAVDTELLYCALEKLYLNPSVRVVRLVGTWNIDLNDFQYNMKYLCDHNDGSRKRLIINGVVNASSSFSKYTDCDGDMRNSVLTLIDCTNVIIESRTDDGGISVENDSHPPLEQIFQGITGEYCGTGNGCAPNCDANCSPSFETLEAFVYDNFPLIDDAVKQVALEQISQIVYEPGLNPDCFCWRLPQAIHHEWGHLITLNSCTDVEVKNLNLSGGTGEAILLNSVNFSLKPPGAAVCTSYIGQGYVDCLEASGSSVPAHDIVLSEMPNYCYNIKLHDNVIDDAYRNGIAVISGIEIEISGNRISNTLGVSPKAGIDIEPDRCMHEVNEIDIVGNTFENNRTGIAGSYYIANKSPNLDGNPETFNVDIIGNTFIDHIDGILLGTHLEDKHQKCYDEDLEGVVNIEGNTMYCGITDNEEDRMGIALKSQGSTETPGVDLLRFNINDNVIYSQAGCEEGWDFRPFVIRYDGFKNAEYNMTFGNVFGSGNRVIDNHVYWGYQYHLHENRRMRSVHTARPFESHEVLEKCLRNVDLQVSKFNYFGTLESAWNPGTCSEEGYDFDPQPTGYQSNALDVSSISVGDDYFLVNSEESTTMADANVNIRIDLETPSVQTIGDCIQFDHKYLPPVYSIVYAENNTYLDPNQLKLCDLRPGEYCLEISECEQVRYCTVVEGSTCDFEFDFDAFVQDASGDNGSIQLINLTPEYCTSDFEFYWYDLDVTSSFVGGLVPGEYCVKITATGGTCEDDCELFKCFTVAGESCPDAFTVENVIIENSDCGRETGSIDFELESELCRNGGFSYQWSHGPKTPSVSDLGPGTYSVTVTSNDPSSDCFGCTLVEEFTIAAENPDIWVGECVQPICVTANGEGGFQVLNWGAIELLYLNGLTGYWTDNGSTVPNRRNITNPGTYCFRIGDGIDSPQSSCIGDICIDVPTFITEDRDGRDCPALGCNALARQGEQRKDDSALKVSPNPTTDILNISNFNEASRIILTDVHGKIIMDVKPKNSLDMAHLIDGLYILTVLGKEGEVELQEKIIKM